MKRREALQLLGNSALLTTLPSFLKSNNIFAAERGQSDYLFFSQNDIPRIQKNRNTDLLKTHFQTILHADIKEDKQFINKSANTKDLVREFARMQAPVNKQGAMFFLNQSSREPVTEPDEMVPLWKILHVAGIDWTYSSEWWDGANYCLFTGDPDDWEYTVRKQAEVVDALDCRYYINTE